jgi:uncharacterized membrane protein
MTKHWAAPTRLTWAGIGFATTAWVVTSAFLAAIYPRLPFGLPVRYVLDEPLIYQVKTPVMVMLPAIVQMTLLLIFGSLVLLLLWRSRPTDHTTASDDDTLRMRFAAEGIALLGAIWIAVQAVGAARLILMWFGGRSSFGPGYSGVMITAVVLSIVIAARTMKLVGRERKATPAVDPAVWRLNRLYFNPGDPALFVPTRKGLGWTLNFGRPVAIAFLAITLTMGVGGPYLFARFVLRGLGN